MSLLRTCALSLCECLSLSLSLCVCTCIISQPSVRRIHHNPLQSLWLWLPPHHYPSISSCSVCGPIRITNAIYGWAPPCSERETFKPNSTGALVRRIHHNPLQSLRLWLPPHHYPSISSCSVCAPIRITNAMYGWAPPCSERNRHAKFPGSLPISLINKSIARTPPLGGTGCKTA